MIRPGWRWGGLVFCVGLAIAGAMFLREAGLFWFAAEKGLRVEVDLSANRVYVYRGKERIRSYAASVGKPGYETPTGSYAISQVIWNPSWNPPPSDWARDKEPESPGPDNPMGRVKLNFSSMYFIHGTPHTGQLGEPASHGCVRLANGNAIDLARLVMRHGAPGVSSGQISQVLKNSGETRSYALSNPVPLRVKR